MAKKTFKMPTSVSTTKPTPKPERQTHVTIGGRKYPQHIIKIQFPLVSNDTKGQERCLCYIGEDRRLAVVQLVSKEIRETLRVKGKGYYYAVIERALHDKATEDTLDNVPPNFTWTILEPAPEQEW